MPSAAASAILQALGGLQPVPADGAEVQALRGSETGRWPMTGPGALPSPRPELLLLEAMRQAKADFFKVLCAASVSENPDVQVALRQESAFQLAEFFYLVEAYGMGTPEAIRRLADAHNAYLHDLAKDREKMRRMGLRPDRIERAIFGPEHLAKLGENYARTPPAIDQSDLSRLLTIVMSSETCRKLCVACEDAGFLARAKSPYGAMLVRSTGVMERIYGEHLTKLHENLERDVYGGSR
jgi:hypothetical protein